MSDEDDFVRITLRIPKDVHQKLNEAAGGKRSMNAEIIARLEHSFLTHAEANPDLSEKLDSFSEALAEFTKSFKKWDPEKLLYVLIDLKDKEKADLTGERKAEEPSK